MKKYNGGDIMQTGRFTFTARSVPDCEEFLKLNYQDEGYLKIDEFFEKYNKPTNDILEHCSLSYRGKQETYKDYVARSIAFSEELELVRFNGWKLIFQPHIRASVYFTEKATDCLQNARFFAMKSAMLLDCDNSIPWKYGYVPQFSMRCTYFGTAATWYSNTFDQILQMVYWGYELYTSVEDRKGNPYNDTWDVKSIMALCNYDFVVKELKNRGYADARKLLTSCFDKIGDVRTWANYIKHKGGIEYLYLEPEPPFQIYIRPIEESNGSSPFDIPPEDRFAIKNFKSPIEVDIDDKLNVINDTHKALVECLSKIIENIDFDKYQIQFG